eukprot:m.426721 g.426721  ORF g.426721 m.426721 type:complete len:675 (+) comp20222_c11_seq13:112-2136(+)
MDPTASLNEPLGSSLRAVELQIDSEHERRRVGSVGSHRGGALSTSTSSSSSAAGGGGSSNASASSSSTWRHSPVVSIPSKPVKTTIGFGASSLTRTASADDPLHAHAGPSADGGAAAAGGDPSAASHSSGPQQHHYHAHRQQDDAQQQEQHMSPPQHQQHQHQQHTSQPQSQPQSPQHKQQQRRQQDHGQDPAPTGLTAKQQRALQYQQQHGNQHQKKPKLTKAERRAIQEKQRAEKEKKRLATQGSGGAAGGGSGGAGGGGTSGGGNGGGNVSSSSGSDKKKVQQHVVASNRTADSEKRQKAKSKALARLNVPERERAPARKQVGLFSHLEQFQHSQSLTRSVGFSGSPIHPAILRCGLRISEGILRGSTERCVAMLEAFKVVFQDYKTPSGKEIGRDLLEVIKPYISFLTECRQLSVSMGNAIKFLKHEITHQVPPSLPEHKAKERLVESVDKFLDERIVLAQVRISELAREKIHDGDVILVFMGSQLLYNILRDAHDEGIKFQVYVVDARPALSGRSLVEKLAAKGIRCSYVMITGLSYIINQVSKVFLSAHALLANGYVMGRVGASMVALMAKTANVPVLVCCETYKFCERVQTDSFVFNELGDPDDLAGPRLGHPNTTLKDWEENPSLKLLNLCYDVTPAEFVDGVITELGMIPCTSVPVVLRVTDTFK